MSGAPHLAATTGPCLGHPGLQATLSTSEEEAAGFTPRRQGQTGGRLAKREPTSTNQKTFDFLGDQLGHWNPMARSLKAGSTTGVSARLQPHGNPYETACRDVQAPKGLLG